MPLAPFISRVVLKNYKSIESCDVTLGPLTFLVGPNGSGKSNFLDALNFIKDALSNLEIVGALNRRGGVKEIAWQRRRPAAFQISLELRLFDGTRASYDLAIKEDSRRVFEVEREEYGGEGWSISASTNPAAWSTDGRSQSINTVLRQMGFYLPLGGLLRDHQDYGSPDRLESNGRNAARVLDRIAGKSTRDKARIDEYLGLICQGVTRVEQITYGTKDSLRFYQSANGKPIEFEAQSMSDGTLRALCVLIALFQSFGEREERTTLVGIEEPETALHPAALGALLDAMDEATERTQVIVTTHSAELLDRKDIPAESIIAVESVDGRTRLGHIDEASRSVLKDRLFTAGELLRANQLQPQKELAPKE